MSYGKPNKRKNYEIVQQLKYLPQGGISKLERLLDGDPQIKHWAMCIHDKDEAPHVHILVRMKTSCPFSTVAKKLNLPAQCVEKIKSSFPHALCYLTHANKTAREQGKYLYPDKAVKSNFDWQTERNRALEKEKEKLSDAVILQRIADGSIPLCDLSDFASDAQQIRIGERKINHAANICTGRMGYDCEQETFLIWGDAGTGKTLLAKHLAKEKTDGRYYLAGAQNDPWEDYKGEKVAVLDDYRPRDVTFSEFLRLADPYTQTPVRSRYHNKRPNLDLLIITTTQTPLQFYKGFDGAEGEDLRQIQRRFSKIIELRPGKMIVTETKTNITTVEKFDLEKLIESNKRR